MLPMSGHPCHPRSRDLDDYYQQHASPSFVVVLDGSLVLQVQGLLRLLLVSSYFKLHLLSLLLEVLSLKMCFLTEEQAFDQKQQFRSSLLIFKFWKGIIYNWRQRSVVDF